LIIIIILKQKHQSNPLTDFLNLHVYIIILIQFSTTMLTKRL